MQTPPSSGLSLFIHLAIIAVASLFGLIVGRRTANGMNLSWLENSFPELSVIWFRRIFSVLIILFLTILMMLSMTIAIRTGLREGAREPHIRYVKQSVHTAYLKTPVLAQAAQGLVTKTLTFERSHIEKSPNAIYMTSYPSHPLNR